MTRNSIVISAVNLVEGGGLSVLVDCLTCLARSSYVPKYRVVVLVNNRRKVPELSGIEYLEIPKAKKNYLYRIYYENVHYYWISRKIRPTLWLSLHDMSPKVKAEVQAVYMHNPTPFYSPNKLTWIIAPLTAVWAYLYKYVYRINIHSNNYLIVQQQWLREEFSKMFSVAKEKIIVARPVIHKIEKESKVASFGSKARSFVFFYPSYPRVFKNFEVICEAAKLLDLEGITDFKVKLTIDGCENKYSRYIYKTYKDLKTLEFIGLQPKSDMPILYSNSDCLIFPSKLETWGLPLSEYQAYHKPILVANLPYAHESSEGADLVCFFNPDNAAELAIRMKDVLLGDMSRFKSLVQSNPAAPYSESWEGLYDILLGEH